MTKKKAKPYRLTIDDHITLLLAMGERAARWKDPLGRRIYGLYEKVFDLVLEKATGHKVKVPEKKRH